MPAGSLAVQQPPPRYFRRLPAPVSTACLTSPSQARLSCDSALSRAASGPWLSSTSRPVSSSTGTPRASARSYLDPGLAPATTKPVFFDTEPDTFPPRVVIASAASPLVRPDSVPVMTTVTPASGPPAAESPPAFPSSVVRTGGTNPSCASATPAARHLSRIAACQSTVNQSRAEAAIVGPTSSTSTRCSGDDAGIAAPETQFAASA